MKKKSDSEKQQESFVHILWRQCVLGLNGSILMIIKSIWDFGWINSFSIKLKVEPGEGSC